MEKLSSIKMQIFCASKDVVNRGETSANHISEKGLISRVYRGHNSNHPRPR